MTAPSLEQQIAAVTREIALRERPAAEIPMRPGLSLLIEERDLWWFGYWRWSLHKGHRTWYLYRKEYSEKPSAFWLHREIMGAPPDILVDHINGNGLDNRRCNLRLATRKQNNWNRANARPRPYYRGVSFHRKSGLWRARLRKEDGSDLTTYHYTEPEAARAWDKMAKGERGEFATLNFANRQDPRAHEIACMRAVLGTLMAARINASIGSK